MTAHRVPMLLTDLPSWDSDGSLITVVEDPRGSRNKVDYDPDWGVFRLTKVLPKGMVFPYDFGFVPGTQGEDGDPLDVLILLDGAVAPGTVVPARLLGVIEARQREDGGEWVRNDRFVALATCSSIQVGIEELSDLGAPFLDEIETFFSAYHALDAHIFEPVARRGPGAATRLVRKASTSSKA